MNSELTQLNLNQQRRVMTDIKEENSTKNTEDNEFYDEDTPLESKPDAFEYGLPKNLRKNVDKKKEIKIDI